MGSIFKDNVEFRNGQLVTLEDGEVKETITTADTKQFFTTAVNKFFMNDDPDADMGWKNLFRVIPGRGHGELLPFRPPDATSTVSTTATYLAAEDVSTSGSHGIVFEEVGEGGEIKFSRVTSAEKYVRHIKYGTAIGYSNEWFSDGSMGLIEMTTEDFRRAAADKMAAIHYAAIAAAVTSGLSTSIACTAGTGTAQTAKFLNQLNTTVAAMKRAKRRPTILLTAPENESFVNLALAQRVQGGNPAVVQNEMTKRLKVQVSEYVASGYVYVIEPNRRLISTNRLPLSLGNFQDLLHDSEVLVGKFRRGVLVGEAAVIRAITSTYTTVLASVDY